MLFRTFANNVPMLAVLVLGVPASPAHGSASTAGSKEYRDVVQTVGEAVQSWTKVNKITVTPEASQQISSAFAKESTEEEGILSRAFSARGLQTQARRRLLTSVVSHYLFELRDSGESIGDGIAEGELARLPPDRFLAQTRVVLDAPSGGLVVNSRPDGAAITIDQKGAGLTNRGFELSVGPHPVTVLKPEDKLDCKWTVQIRDGKTETLTCPAQEKK